MIMHLTHLNESTELKYFKLKYFHYIISADLHRTTVGKHRLKNLSLFFFFITAK